MLDKISYDPETGEFIWLVSGYRNKIGMRAGSQNTQGYRHIYINKRCYKEHRLAFYIMTGKWPKKDIDHINNVKNDNRWINLREANRSENICNRPPSIANTSGIKGVYYFKSTDKWGSCISVDKKRIFLGVFKSKEEAALAYNKAAKQYYGDFVYENSVNAG